MPPKPRPVARFTILLTGMAMLAGCQVGTPYRNPVARLDPDMRAVVDRYGASGAVPVHTLSVTAARGQPTMLAAFQMVMQGKPRALAPASVSTATVDGAAGPLTAQLYNGPPGRRGLPVILYFHGGLGVTGSAAADDAAARALAAEGKAMVLSVDYRLAPENKFPAAYDDAVASYRWLLAHAAGLGGDVRRIALAGEGFGGTLALDVAIAARDGGIGRPVHLLLIDPIGGTATRTNASIRNTYSVPLDRADVAWGFDRLTVNGDGLQDKRLNLVADADLHGLPPVSLVYSEMNPLDTDAKVLGAKLQASGVDVRQQQYAGTTYGFFGMGAGVARAKEAEDFAGVELTGTFDHIGAPPVPRVPHPVHRASQVHRRR